MKSCIKYCILAIFALLLFNNTANTTAILCNNTSSIGERCAFSQAPTARQTIVNSYKYFSSMTLCLEHVDVAHVPADKSIILPFSHTKRLLLATAAFSAPFQHLSSYCVPNPHVYYVFGLRKIII